MNILEAINNEEFLTESGIKMPPGTKACKLVLHRDMDGFFSGLFSYHQLLRQGIKPANITIQFAQYGDEEQELIDKVESHNKQMAIVVDFAALPKANLYDIVDKASGYKIGEESFMKFLKIISRGNLSNIAGFKEYAKKYLRNDVSDDDLNRMHKALKHFDFKNVKEPFNKDDYNVSLTQPDFVSDHHQDTKGNLTKGKSGTIAAKDKAGHAYKSDSEHIAIAYAPNIADSSTIKAVTNIDSAKYTNIQNTIDLPKEFKAKGRMERLAILTNTLLSDVLKRNETLAVNILKASSPSLVNVYNNILKMGKYNDQQVDIYEEMVKDNPDWNRISSLRSGMPSNMAKETTKENLKGKKKLNSLDDWRKKGEDDVAKAKTGYWSRKDEADLDVEKEKKRKGEDGLEDNQIELAKSLQDHIKELKRKIAEMEKLKASGREEDYKYAGGHSTKTKPLSKDIFEKLLAGNKEELAKAEAKYNKYYPSQASKVDALEAKKKSNNSQFTTIGNVMRQDATATRDYPSRFLGSMLNRNGIRYPFLLKRFATFMQVSMSPDAPEEIKKNVDLGKISNEILAKIKEKFATKYNNWAFEIINKESGGHAGITNVAGLGTLGLMPKKDRERYANKEYDRNEKGNVLKAGLDDLNKRAVAAGTSLKKIEEKARAKGTLKPEEKSLYQEYKALKEKREFTAKTRTEIMDEIEKMFYTELVKHKGLITTKQPNKEKFDIGENLRKPKPKLEENLLDIVGELIL